MPVETPSIFARVIQDHLELKERNSRLEHSMPLGRYKVEDPFHNHPLFKTEEQARIEDTLDGAVAAHVPGPAMAAWPGEEPEERTATEFDSGLWSRSRDFDWGD
ncbi:MAG TPA: hypothetical protein VF101_01250 [Gaiellaceae bacterium]